MMVSLRKSQTQNPKAQGGLGIRSAAVALAVLLTVIGSIRTMDARAQAPPAQGQGNAATGRALYTKAGCETCHGADGRGTAAAPAIAGSARQLPAFIAYVRKPAGTMPPHGAQMVPDSSLADIYAFLRAMPASPAGQAAASAPAGRVDAGAMAYRRVGCYQCHVNEGQGGANGPRIGPDPIPFARFVQYVRNPAGEMPPYTEKVLSSSELADIYAFLQARPRPPAVNSIPQLAP